MSPFLPTIVLVLLAVVAAGAAGCQDAVLVGSGVRAEQQRQVPRFTAVVLDVPSSLRITCGTAQSVTIAADDNLLAHLETRVQDGVLTIACSRSFQAKEPLTIDLGMPELRLLRLANAGAAELTGVVAHELQLVVAGAGTIRAAGTTTSARYEVTGTGTIDAARLTAGTASARVSGTGTIATAPTSELAADISGTGTITYEGHPRVRSQISGLGTVKAAASRQ